MKLFSAAFLWIGVINTIGMEAAFADCITYSSCYLSCIDEIGVEAGVAAPPRVRTVAVDTRSIASKRKAE